MRFATGCALVLILFAQTAAWSGGSGDDDEHNPDDGLRFFGFVKDTRGRVIRDASVTANIQGMGAMKTRTDATGVYKFPSMGKQIPPNRVTISCSKDGYKQTRVFNRGAPTKAAVTAVEVECAMEPIGGK